MKKRNLTFKFTIVFVIFTILTLLICAILSYLNQARIYKQQREENVQFVASYLQELLAADDIYFIWYQHYFMEASDSLLIPKNFDNDSVQNSRLLYEDALSKEFPGLVLGADIGFDDLSVDTKNAYEVYSHEYYQSAFEKAQKMFNLANVYYLAPESEGSDTFAFVIDSVRREKNVNGKKYLSLGKKINYSKDKYSHFWEAWKTGVSPKGYDVFENKYTKNYIYYTPLFINGEKLGVICVEAKVGEIIQEIHLVTFRSMIIVGIVLIVLAFFLLLFIRARYIKKLVLLQKIIEEYSQTKNIEIADKLSKLVTNSDEISSIMGKFSDMIRELDLYMKSLSRTAMALQDTRQKAMEMSELAIKDSLTGIRNKTAYDKEVQKIQYDISQGLKDIGIGMIDLNYLKKINDTYGHDKGNVAIITLCKIVCKIFEHSPVFRIGGDEFVVILKGHDLEHIDELITEFNLQLKDRQEDSSLEYWERTSAAIGYAVYNPDIDSSVEDIFKRADEEMYCAKKEMKASRE